jgi:hypothetical protein
MNDGLPLPAVLALTAALALDSTDFVWWRFILQDISLGLAFGVVVGVAAARLIPRGGDGARAVTAHQQLLYGLGVAFLTYGVGFRPSSHPRIIGAERRSSIARHGSGPASVQRHPRPASHATRESR